MIENRNLSAGTRLVAKYKKQAFVCTVEAGEEGKLAFVLEDGKRYTSPSSAGGMNRRKEETFDLLGVVDTGEVRAILGAALTAMKIYRPPPQVLRPRRVLFDKHCAVAFHK